MCAALLLFIAVWTVTGGSDRASADTYEVQRGDTLSGIASCLNVSTSVLQALNSDISSPDAIFIGQRIQVPDNAENLSNGCSEPTRTEDGVTSTNTESRVQTNNGTNSDNSCTHLIQPNDNLSNIAPDYGTDTSTMIRLNPNINPNLLWVGATLIVPCASSTISTQTEPDAAQALTAGILTDDSDPSITRVTEYTVKANEWATEIAERFGVSLELLREHNPRVNLNLIHPGDVLRIPIPDYLAPALEPSEAQGILTTTYTVRTDDIASRIADRFGISLADLRQLNGGSSLNHITIGQTLTVPWTGPSADASPGSVPAVEVRRRTYRVQPLDTFQSIAASHSLSMEQLRSLNAGRPNDLVAVGELLFLPGNIDAPVVSEERTLWEADLVQYAAAILGVTPHTLLANHAWVEPGQWLAAGTTWHVPLREGLLVTVQAGDTLQGIANAHGVNMSLILADPANGVDDPNAIVIGQEIIVPLIVPDFAWPAQGELTDPFGLCRSWDCSYRHNGLDMALDFYVPIVAAADGLVTFVGGDSAFGLGWYVEIEHDGGWSTTYAHLVEFNVQQGQYVTQGDIIGYNGNTGYSTGPHLHFEVRHNDWYVDPLVVLP